MRIDDTIIKEFLTNQESTDYSDHWIFSAIEKGRNLFEYPKPSESQSVAWKYKRIVDATKTLVPLNPQFVAELFPDFNTMAENATLILSVGCPDPYDAIDMYFYAFKLTTGDKNVGTVYLPNENYINIYVMEKQSV